MDVDRGARRQTAFAGAAAVTAGLVVLLSFAIAPLLAGHFIGTAAVAAVPLLLREAPKAFARACLAVGAGLAVWGMIGAPIGMFLFLPTALLLLITPFVNPGNRPGVWFTVLTPVAAAVLYTVTWTALYPEEDHEPPQYFKATLDSVDRWYDPAFQERQEHLVEFGAREVTGENHEGTIQLVVSLEPSWSEGVLREELAGLPGVVELQACTDDGCEPVGDHG
ncbi:hypothetical protein ACGFMM_04290 [Streptomyces sp. NPDC048604]|uniref:hypothetical protein n=1 Tax=Streptomyces sp. NPDC048604 TaxID=3365578 RepID=UPI003722ECD2